MHQCQSPLHTQSVAIVVRVRAKQANWSCSKCKLRSPSGPFPTLQRDKMGRWSRWLAIAVWERVCSVTEILVPGKNITVQLYHKKSRFQIEDFKANVAYRLQTMFNLLICRLIFTYGYFLLEGRQFCYFLQLRMIDANLDVLPYS